MKAAIFIRRNGAGGLGHVGWAFEYTDGLHNAGAVENPPGTPVASPTDMGFWTVKTNNPVQPMQQRDYDGYKIIDLERGNAPKAWSTVLWVKKQWYTLLFGNCMDDVYNVLTAYGVQLPLPAQYVTPNAWFDALPWSYYGIRNTWLHNVIDAAPDAYKDLGPLTFTEELEAGIADAAAPEWISLTSQKQES